jgi:hypothetical protein
MLIQQDHPMPEANSRLKSNQTAARTEFYTDMIDWFDWSLRVSVPIPQLTLQQPCDSMWTAFLAYNTHMVCFFVIIQPG